MAKGLASKNPRKNVPPEGRAPLNFKVPKDFRREFKTYASQHDMKMVELLQQGFLLVKERHGEK